MTKFSNVQQAHEQREVKQKERQEKREQNSIQFLLKHREFLDFTVFRLFITTTTQPGS